MSRIKSLYKTFDHWQNDGNIVLVGDTHFNDIDRELMGYTIGEREQCKVILQSIRSGDTVVFLGDIGNPSWINYIKKQRNRLRMVLIAGNHDAGEVINNEVWDEVYKGPLLISPKIMLSHEPVIADFWVNFHGHTHANDAIDGMIKVRDGYIANGFNLTGNSCGYSAFQLNDYINGGGLKHISDIHRQTIDTATERKKAREEALLD